MLSCFTMIVYADIVMLSKSNDLGKSVLDMNQHYLELKTYLQEVEHHPEVVMDKCYTIWKRIFMELIRKLTITNIQSHRAVYVNLFAQDESDSASLYPLLISQMVRIIEICPKTCV